MICYERYIFSLYLSLYTTYLLQPLNVAIFGPLQKKYEDFINKKCESNIKFINKNLFINLYTETREQTFRPTIIKIEFRTIELILLNPQKIYKRFFQKSQKDHFTTSRPKFFKSKRFSSKIFVTIQQIRIFLDIITQNPLSQLRLIKLKKKIFKLYTDNVFLNQQNRLLFNKNRIKKIKFIFKKLIFNNDRLLIKKTSLI